MVIMGFDFKSLLDEIKNSLLLHLKQKEKNVRGIGWRCSSLLFGRILERKRASLYKYTRSDRRRSSEQEGKTFYAGQATRGLRDREFLQTP